MDPFQYTTDQLAIIEHSASGSIFLQGPAGSGKTTAGAARMASLLMNGTPANKILVLVPQRTLAVQFFDVRSDPNLPPGGIVDILTIGGLSQRMVQVFWPMIAKEAGFSNPDHTPTFLNIETAQYYMARLIQPLLEKGYFDTVHLDRNRIYSQILSNLNSAAASGFSCEEIGERLINAWEGKPEQKNVYAQAQECALLFRNYCKANNLLDFSLSLEVFCSHIWPSLLGRKFLFNQYRHLIYDNIEEDFPVAHDIVRNWVPELESVLMIQDSGGGYRSFLGADPHSAASLADSANEIINFSDSLVTPPALLDFKQTLTDSISQSPFEMAPEAGSAARVIYRQYFHELMDWVGEEIADLVVNKGFHPRDISVLAPFMTDTLRFSLATRLERSSIPSRSHRPSRALRDEPATRCLLALARLAHPAWNLRLELHDIRFMLMLAIADLDLTRADLLAREVFSLKSPFRLLPFDQIKGEKQDRITYRIGEKYEILRRWLEEYQSTEPVDLDICLSRLFGEILSQDGYGFHDRFDAATIAARLIESIQEFRWSTNETEVTHSLGLDYVHMVEEGVIGSQFLQSWIDQPDDAVFLAPAYTFLVSNRPSRVQFWIDVGSPGWWERLDQPLTQPYVLNRNWSTGSRWNTHEEIRQNQENMARLVSGLIHRCGDLLYLCASEINERGDDQQGPLAVAVNKVLRQAPEMLERGPRV